MSTQLNQKNNAIAKNNVNRRRTLGAVNTNQGRRVSFVENVTLQDENTLTNILDEDVLKTARPSSSSSNRRITMAAPRISSTQEDKSGNNKALHKNGNSMSSPSTLAKLNRRKSSMGVHHVDPPSSSIPNSANSYSISGPSMAPSSTHTTDMTLEVPPSIHDKAYFNSCIKTLVTYLHTHGFYNSTNTSGNHWHTHLSSSKGQNPPSSTAQKNSTKDQPCPSSKEFINIVTFLFRKWDPTFLNPSSSSSSSSTTAMVKVEEEIHFTFKILGYPHNISKTTLAAAGSSHTWPTLVQALAWFVQLLEYFEYGRELELEEEHMDQEDEESWLQDLCKRCSFTHESEEMMLSMTEERKKEILSIQECLMDALHNQAMVAFHKFTRKGYPLFLLERDDEVDKLEISIFLDKVEQGNMKIEKMMEDLVQWNSTLIEGIQKVEQSVQE